MKNKFSWVNLKQKEANIWLTAIVVLFIFSALASFNFLLSNRIQGNTSYAKRNQTLLTPSQSTTTNNIYYQPSLRLIPEPAQVAYGKNIYLRAEFSNVSNCEISGPTNAEKIPVATSDSVIVVGSAPESSPNNYAFYLHCKDLREYGVTSLPAIVTFFDPNNDPSSATITGIEISLDSAHFPLSEPVSNGVIKINEGSGLQLNRVCVNAQSGYITNADGTILSTILNKTKPTETLLVLHDKDGSANGIHTNKTYTAHCFSGARQNKKETTASLTVKIR